MNVESPDGPVELDDATVIFTPPCDISKLDHERLAFYTESVRTLLNRTEVRNLVIDFQHTTYFASDAVNLFARFWKAVCGKQGQMALCGVSAQEKEILDILQFSKIWPIVPSRQEALNVVSL